MNTMLRTLAERPTWKNTLASGHATHALDDFVTAAKRLGYTYFEWNDQVFFTRPEDSELHVVGRFGGGQPVCYSEELDQPGGVLHWLGGVRPLLQDAKLLAHEMLLDIVLDRLARALMALVWPGMGDLKAALKSVSGALDDESLRGSDSTGLIAKAVSDLRSRIIVALRICDEMIQDQKSLRYSPWALGALG